MPEHPRRRRRRAEPLPAEQALKRFRRRSGGPGPAAGPAGAAAAAWPAVVGEAAARFSVPVRCTRAGVLTVACADAAWAHELSARREELAARLREALPATTVTSLRFSIADHALQGAPAAEEPPPAPDPVRPGAADRAAGTAAAEGVEDPVLRDLVRRAAAASSARRSVSPDR